MAERHVGVNPLHLGELISTKDEGGNDEKIRNVSIPFTSGNSFLRIPCPYGTLSSAGVNPLHLGELISTMRSKNEEKSIASCVNPLHLGELISTISIGFFALPLYLCQSPSPRGTHFYIFQKKCSHNSSSVSIPFTSGNSFLRWSVTPNS